MSVFISSFTTTPWIVTHDDAPGGSHTGTIDPATILHTTDPMTGAENHNYIALTCPVCGSVSTHPVGGGAQPGSVQHMFVIHAQSNGCPCGQVEATDPDALADSHVRLQISRMDGPERIQI